MAAPVTDRWTVFTAPSRIARSPLEKARKNRAGAPMMRSSTAAWTARPVLASSRIAAMARMASRTTMASPAPASPATSMSTSEPEAAGMALSMRRPVATGVTSPASAAGRPQASSIAKSPRALPRAKRRMSRVPSGRGAKVRWKTYANGARRVASASSTGQSWTAPPASARASIR